MADRTTKPLSATARNRARSDLIPIPRESFRAPPVEARACADHGRRAAEGGAAAAAGRVEAPISGAVYLTHRSPSRHKYTASLLMAESEFLPRAVLGRATGSGGAVSGPRLGFFSNGIFAESGVRRPLMPNPPGSFRAVPCRATPSRPPIDTPIYRGNDTAGHKARESINRIPYYPSFTAALK